MEGCFKAMLTYLLIAFVCNDSHHWIALILKKTVMILSLNPPKACSDLTASQLWQSI